MTLCYHKNEADNCLLCGTKVLRSASYSELPFSQPRTSTPDYRTDYHTQCKAHNSALPCAVCEMEDIRDGWLEDQRQKLVESINQNSVLIWTEIEKAKFEERWPGGKCEHGCYLFDDYCNVCSIALIEPDYDRNKYRDAINKALKGAKINLRGTEQYRGVDRGPVKSTGYNENLQPPDLTKETKEGFRDLLILVDLEIWKAARKYGDQMNDALAYTIARNTAGRFQAELIDDQTILTDVAWEFMPTTFLQQAQALFQRVGDLDGLLRLSKDDRADSEDRALARKIIIKYGERTPRYKSLDAPTKNEAGKDNELELPDPATVSTTPDLATLIAENRSVLEALVRTWRGAQRLVGEAVLNGKTTREVRGVPQKTAQRVRKAVLEAFRKHMQTQGL